MVTLTRPEGSRTEDFHLTRRGVASVFFTGYALAAFSANADPIHTDEAGLIVETATLPSLGFDLPAYVARPKTPERFPAVIVASEIFGVHDYIKDICRRLAKLRYVAIAPAFFRGETLNRNTATLVTEEFLATQAAKESDPA